MLDQLNQDLGQQQDLDESRGKDRILLTSKRCRQSLDAMVLMKPIGCKG